MQSNDLTLTISTREFEQLTCDIECCIDELTELSKNVDWYTTDLPDRLLTCLEILSRAE